MIDRVQFSQLLQNLISNSIKYRREEPPVIRVEAKRDSSNWIFSVSDNGQGFNQQFAERIFGLFQRLHGRDAAGTGMGLSIARKVVERHGGRIWAESAEGVGSTFYFSLPVSLEGSRNEVDRRVCESSRASAVVRKRVVQLINVRRRRGQGLVFLMRKTGESARQTQFPSARNNRYRTTYSLAAAACA